MRRTMLRLAMGAIGLLAFAFYASWAYLTYWAIQALWINRPSAAVSVAILAGATVVVGYASYRYGSARLLASIPATPASPVGAPWFFRRLEALCARMGVSVPTVMIAHTGEPNAFAIRGPDGGVVVIDLALIRLLTPRELDAVMAHELAHLEGYETLVQTLGFTAIQTVVLVLSLALAPGILLLTGAGKGLAWLRGRPRDWEQGLAGQFLQLLGVLVMLGPLAVAFVLFARSRRLEFAADRRAATVTGNPLALVRALRKIEAAVQRDVRLRTLFGSTDEDLTRDPLFWLLSTHPATDERVERLVALAAERPRAVAASRR